jgi:hemolysin D
MSNTSPKQQRHPTLELLGRYKAVFSAAWAYRKELAGPKRMGDEAAFLPAALSLVETPVHPAPRRFAFAIMALFAIAVIWACFGKVDIVAVAPGRIIVSDRTKLIQPLEASVVRKVLVKDGDRVQAGQVLVELDTTIATADKTAVQEQLSAAASEVMRTSVLLQLLSNQKQTKPILRGLEADLPKDLYAKTASSTSGASTKPSTIRWSTAEHAAAQAQLLAEWQDINAKLAKLDAEANRRNAEIGTVQQTVAKLSATVPMAQTREADFKKLVEQGFVSSHMTQDKTRERVELERDLSTTQARLAEAQSTLYESQQARVAFKMETQRLLNDRQAQAASKLQQLAQDQTKAAQRERQTQLIAPVAGVIQQLAIHSIGGVVTPAQPLMVVVPDSSTVTAEIAIANQDIGFVNAGQMAEVKLETFSYTKYGTVSATVNIVTADAVTDEKKGSYYPATLTLAKGDMLVDGKRVNITPGMNVTAEIKTGQRRIIEYLLSAVQRARSESLRER